MQGMGFGQAASALVSLTVIFAVLTIAILVARRLRHASHWRGAAATITVLGARSLGGQNTLVIAQAEGKRFLIGVSRSGMTAIGRLDDLAPHD